MQVDVIFEFAKVYNVDKKIDVVKGQKFSINTDLTGGSKWFSDNDPVLSINVVGSNANIEASELGTSTILIMGTDFGIQKELIISVVEDVNQASSLGVESGQPVTK